MRKYRLASLIITFIIIFVFSNLLVAQSKYRELNPYDTSTQLNPYNTNQLDRVKQNRASSYSKMQSRYINEKNSNINDYFNYETGVVTYNSNLYNTDHFGMSDEFGRKYDRFYDYKAGNQLYGKEYYNTDYFVRTDNFGNKYDKFFDYKSGSASYGKDYKNLDYFYQTDEFNEKKDKFFDLNEGVYKYREDFQAESDFQKYEGDPRHYDKQVISQKDYDIDLRRDKLQQDNFYKYDRYGNKYDKFFETPVNEQKTKYNKQKDLIQKYEKPEKPEKQNVYSEYPSMDRRRQGRVRQSTPYTKDQRDRNAIIMNDNYDRYHPYDYYRTRKYHPYRIYDPYYYDYRVRYHPRGHYRYYYPYRYYTRYYYPYNYFNLYYNRGGWSFGFGLNIGYPYYYDDSYYDYYDDGYVTYDDYDYYYKPNRSSNSLYKGEYYIGIDKFDARKYSERNKSTFSLDKREKSYSPFKESLKKSLVKE